jgi:cell wall-associated NlpC family hydrolase
VFAAGAGALVLWSALKGVSVTGGLRSLLTGKQPVTANTEPITGSVDLTSTGAGTVTGSAVANAGLRYVGSGSVYKWGGGSPAGWDCSGFVNYVIGHDLGGAIPGSPSGGFSGHGPTTFQWALFGTSVPRSQVQAGDLVVWPAFHMGIAVSGTQMVNCPGPNGSPAPVVGGIDINLGVVTYRRLA